MDKAALAAQHPTAPAPDECFDRYDGGEGAWRYGSTPMADMPSGLYVVGPPCDLTRAAIGPFDEGTLSEFLAKPIETPAAGEGIAVIDGGKLAAWYPVVTSHEGCRWSQGWME